MDSRACVPLILPEKMKCKPLPAIPDVSLDEIAPEFVHPSVRPSIVWLVLSRERRHVQHVSRLTWTISHGARDTFLGSLAPPSPLAAWNPRVHIPPYARDATRRGIAPCGIPNAEYRTRIFSPRDTPVYWKYRAKYFFFFRCISGTGMRHANSSHWKRMNEIPGARRFQNLELLFRQSSESFWFRWFFSRT